VAEGAQVRGRPSTIVGALVSGDRRSIAIAQPSIDDDELTAVQEPLRTGWLTQGPKVAAFEKAFAARHAVPHALATTSCTTALHLALVALGVGPGDEVIVPAFTWVATANVVVYCGATPVFVDVDPVTYNLDVERALAAVTSRTRVVLPVHLFGLCADVVALRAGLPDEVHVLEDAACAVGASLDGVPAGGLGTFAAFSFHPRKIITTGEGGMLTTTDAALAEHASNLRNHGASLPEEVRHAGATPFLLPDFDEVGFNYRMSDLQGAVGLAQMGKLDRLLAERRQWADWYTAELHGLGWLRPPIVAPRFQHSWQSYVTVMEPDAPLGRTDVMMKLHEAGVSTRPGTHAVTELGWYRSQGVDPASFPNARMLHEQSLAIPLHNQMTPEDYGYVVEQLRSIC
jgi:perosamine synthetase